MNIERRQFLQLLGGTLIATCLPSAPSWAQESPSVYKLPPLPYAYDALEPYIDAETMKFHHDKHHAAYVKNLNSAVAKYPELAAKTPEELISDIDNLPEDVRNTIRNNGGGHVNHTMFWEIMTPNSTKVPQGELGIAINSSFGSLENFQKAFNQVGSGRFGSGWAWLIINKEGKLQVVSTGNQDNPLMIGIYPIMGNDVWEHAYYLKYRNDRLGYLQQWWNVVNWQEVNRRYLKAKSLK